MARAAQQWERLAVCFQSFHALAEGGVHRAQFGQRQPLSAFIREFLLDFQRLPAISERLFRIAQLQENMRNGGEDTFFLNPVFESARQCQRLLQGVERILGLPQSQIQVTQIGKRAALAPGIAHFANDRQGFG